MKKIKSARIILLILLTALFLSIVFVVHSKFTAPRKTGPNILYRVPESAKMQVITGDLRYYGFVKSESALKFALWIEDDILGKDVKRGATYELSQTKNTWEIANTLLNKVYTGETYNCDHGCPEGNFNPGLLPGGDLAPTIS